MGTEIAPQWRPVFGQLCSAADEKGRQALKEVHKKIRTEPNSRAALVLWEEVCSVSQSSAPKYLAEATKMGSYGPQQLEALLDALALSNVDFLLEMYNVSKSAPLRVYLLPRLVHRLALKGRASAAVEVLKGLSSKPSQSDRKAREMAVNALLLAAENPYDILKNLVSALPPNMRFLSGVAVRLYGSIPPKELVELFELLDSAQVNWKGSNSFLRKVYMVSDAGADAVVTALINDSERSLVEKADSNICYFLVSDLTKRGQKTEVDKILECLVPFAAAHPERLSFVLHLLVIRMLAFEEMTSVLPVLSEFGSKIPEPTWRQLFRQFRINGCLDKCAETLRQTLAHDKLSLPFLGEYLTCIAQFYPLHTYVECLRMVIPEITPTLRLLKIDEIIAELPGSAAQTELPLLTPEHRNFPVNRIHTSWLTITYHAVLNNVDEVSIARQLFTHYLKYVEYSRSKVDLSTIDEFVLRLISLRSPPALSAAEDIFRTTLSVPLSSQRSPSYKCRSLRSLIYAFTRDKKDIGRALSLLSDSLARPEVPVDSQMVEPLALALAKIDPEKAKTFKAWAASKGFEGVFSLSEDQAQKNTSYCTTNEKPWSNNNMM